MAAILALGFVVVWFGLFFLGYRLISRGLTFILYGAGAPAKSAASSPSDF